ncbi:MAG: DNA repair protein RadC [Gammaproteobacteria bacterium]|nr:DNA repair protein RadC [Gammaproteobacteria bacterium]
MNIKDWESPERPRERLLGGGQQNLTDAELLAVLLRTGGKSGNAIVLARRLLGQFGSLRAVLDAPSKSLLACRDLGPAKVACLKAVVPMIARYASSRLRERRVFQGSGDVTLFVMAEYAGLEREVFGCLFLDARHRLLRFEKLFLGSVDRANVYPREVIKQVLACNAAAVIFVHNHPSGVAEPSVSDIELTERLRRLLAELDVKVLDHIVIGSESTVSMAERGLL